MKPEFILALAIAGAVGLAGCMLLAAAFVQIGRRGWSQAMQRTADGRWPRERWLLLWGALLTTLFLRVVVGVAVLEMMSSGWRS
jgi:hypothetical protein